MSSLKQSVTHFISAYSAKFIKISSAIGDNKIDEYKSIKASIVSCADISIITNILLSVKSAASEFVGLIKEKTTPEIAVVAEGAIGALFVLEGATLMAGAATLALEVVASILIVLGIYMIGIALSVGYKRIMEYFVEQVGSLR